MDVFFQIIHLFLHLFHSKFDVGRSMFDVHSFIPLGYECSPPSIRADKPSTP